MVFGVLVALEASLSGWLARNDNSASRLLVLLGTLQVVAVSLAVADANRSAYRGIQQLEDA